MSINENTTEVKTVNQTNNLKCFRPDIEQFPKGFISQYQRVRGGVIIHFLIAIYMFSGLSIVCDKYFVPSLETICKSKIKTFY